MREELVAKITTLNKNTSTKKSKDAFMLTKRIINSTGLFTV